MTKTQADIRDRHGRLVGKVHLSLNDSSKMEFDRAKQLTETLADATLKVLRASDLLDE